MLIDKSDAAQFCENLRRDNKIVFTNGCFDIIHAGHVRYLTTAKNFGDVLIVGLNSGNSVRKLGTSTVSATELISTLERIR